MSHFTKITAEIKDLEALKIATTNMQLSLEENTYCRYYFGREVREHVIKLPGRYDVAVEERENGIYDLDADLFAGQVERYIGAGGSELLRNYSIEKLKIEAKKNGYRVFEAEDGKIKLLHKRSGGKAIVSFGSDGKMTVETSNFKGQSCMAFAIIEKALGHIDDIKKKPDYYQNNESKVQLKEWND